MAIQTHRGNCNTCVNYEFAFHKHNAVTSHDTGQLLNVQRFPLKCIFEILAGYLSKSVTALLCQSAPAHKGYFASTCLKFLPQQGPKMPLESAGGCTHMRAKEQQKQMFHVNGNILGRGDNCVCTEREHLGAVAVFSWELKKAERWMGEERTSDFSLTLGDSVLGSIPGLCPAVSFGSETA